MAGLPTLAVPAVQETAQPQPAVTPSTQENKSAELRDSELQIVSSLAQLQELERRVHRLRTLLPDRLLAPLVPIINPECAASDNPVPESPQVLYAQLSEAARAGVADVEQFQTLWRSPEMKAVWDHVGDEIKENGGTLLQPTGVWERDYGVLLEELVKEKREKDEQDGGVTERSKAQSMAANWRMDVETFLQKGVPGVRVVPDQHEASVTIALVKTGMLFQARAISEPDISVPEWRVSNVGPQSKLKPMLEMAICDCLNSRPRKWDITYLLDMIASYADVKQRPCAKCNKMTDDAAQLPVLRVCKSVPAQASDSGEISIWEPFHPGCSRL